MLCSFFMLLLYPHPWNKIRKNGKTGYNWAVIQGPVAQRLAQATHNRLVAGSNPAGPTSNSMDCGQPRLEK